MNKDGYPSSEDLAKIENWDILKYGTEGLIELVRENWQFADVGFFQFKKTKKNKFTLELHTAGWSGNEDVVRALQENDFWHIYWEKSERGGHYYFKGSIEEAEK